MNKQLPTIQFGDGEPYEVEGYITCRTEKVPVPEIPEIYGIPPTQFVRRYLADINVEWTEDGTPKRLDYTVKGEDVVLGRVGDSETVSFEMPPIGRVCITLPPGGDTP